MTHAEVWYEVQFMAKTTSSRRAGGIALRFDTQESARAWLETNSKERELEWDLRIVKKTLTEEPVPSFADSPKVPR